jgi:YD repeat-containing protein
MRFGFVVVGCLLSSSFIPVLAQTPDPIPTAVTPQNNTGDLPYSTTIGTDVEHVELASGNLIVTIPFVSVPGRKMLFDYGIRYDARMWNMRTFSNITYWQPDERNWLTPTTLGWTGTEGFLTNVQGPAYCVENDGNQPIDPGGNTSIFYTTGGTRVDNYLFTDRHGVKHNFFVNHFDSGVCDRTAPPTAGFNSSNIEGPTPEMDGYYMALGNYSSSASVTYGPDGTSYGGSLSPAISASGGTSDTPHGYYFFDRPAELDVNGNAQAVAPGGQDSIQRTPMSMQVNGNQITYTYQDSNGQPQTYTVNLVNKVISTQFGGGATAPVDYNTNGAITQQVVSSVLLPDGTSYTFQYDSWGEITQITLPSGAVVNYQWETTSVTGLFIRSVSRRSVTHDGRTDVWNFSYSNAGPTQSQGYLGVVNVTSPADNQGQSHTTLYTYDGWQHLIRVQYLATSNPASQVLEYDMTWGTKGIDPTGGIGENGLMTSLMTTLENGQVSLKKYEYDLFGFPYQPFNCGDMGSGFFTCDLLSGGGNTIVNGASFTPAPPTFLPPPPYFPGSHGNVTSIKEYDWGQGVPGPLVRQTIRKYLHDQDPNYFASATSNSTVGRIIRNVVNRVTDQTIYDGSVECFGTGTWGTANDGTIIPPPQCTANKLAETTVVYDHGSGSTYGYLGEATAISRWAGGSTFLTTQFSYDQYGNVISEIDPKGNSTGYGYSDSWTGSSICAIPTNSSAYLTSVTNALQQKSSQSFYQCTGKVASQTDANSNAVSLTYDWLGRPLYVNYPDGGQTHTTYDDVALTTTVDQLMSAAQIHEVITQLDQLGRAIQTRLKLPQDIAYIDTTYDALGRVNTVSIPYRSAADPADPSGITQYFYDARNRKTKQVNPDNTNLSWVYTGDVTTSIDENLNSWVRTADALGRLTGVGEPNGSSTGYVYDVLGNLTTVNQPGLIGETSRPTRSFVYDALSRLTSTTNPETGTVTYQYTANGPLCAGDISLPCSKTDARGITTSYGYDPLNRLISKTYSGPSAVVSATPSSCYQYDTGLSGATGSNFVGRLTFEWTQFGSCPSTIPVTGYKTMRSILAYDQMGRIKTEQQCNLVTCTNGQPYTISPSYDLVGNLTSYDNGVGSLTVTNSYDVANRLFQVTDNANDATHPSSLYNISDFVPFGVPHLSMLGSNLSVTQKYDLRLRPASLSAVKQ